MKAEYVCRLVLPGACLGLPSSICRDGAPVVPGRKVPCVSPAKRKGRYQSTNCDAGLVHAHLPIGHTAPSISIAEGRRSGSAVHHRCGTNDVADGKWSVHLLQVYARV